MKKLVRLDSLREYFRSASLRSHLFALVAVSVLPFLIFAILVLNLFARHEKSFQAIGLRETTRALSSALDREFDATKTALEAIATLEDLDSGDLGQLYRKLRRVLQSRPNWHTITLHDPAGNQVLNLLNPFGEPLPESNIERQSFQALIQNQQPMPINFHRDPANGAKVGYRVPVLRAGELMYVLSVEFDPTVLSELLARQKLPDQTVGSILDSRNVIVATSGSMELVGELAGPLLRTLPPGQIDGWFKGPNRANDLSYAALSRSRANGWSVALVVPASQLDAPLQRLFWSLGGAAVIFLVAGILLAVIVEARISESLRDLTFKAEALGRGERAVGNGKSRVKEVENLSQDIDRAFGLLEQRARERDQAESALRELNDRLELRILERTVQLQGANDELMKEIRERQLAETALRSEHVYLNLLRSTERVIQDSATAAAALTAALGQICRSFDVPFGYHSIPALANEKVRTSFWCADATSDRFTQLQVTLESAAAAGTGPTALALNNGELHCVTLTGRTEPWARAGQAAGLMAACAIPVAADGEPAGALAFFSEKAIELDQRLSTVLRQLETHLGRVIERQRADDALRLSEERFRTAFDEGPIGIGMVDLEMRYLRVNKALCEMLGYGNRDLIGQKFFAIVYPDDLPSLQSKVDGLLKSDSSGFRNETRLIGKTREVLSCCVTGALIMGRHGTPGYILLLIENITESKRLEERLRETERLAAVGATSAMFAHEVGNPLNGISTTVQMIERDLLRSKNGVTPTVFSALDDIKSEITRLGALLHEFRYLARPQRLQLRPVRLDQLVGDVLAWEAYKEKGISIKVDIPVDLPSLSVDEDKLKQSIANLCDNAADAMPHGGTLTVHAYRNRDEVNLEISDTGIGIAPGVNVFELFTTNKPHGTGLGLAVVRQIVSAHGGRVDYQSQPGIGTTFTVTLPLNNHNA
jgi:PAS domain S-box-containing protein